MIVAVYRLFRIPNLLMIALTQYLVLYCLIKPSLPNNAILLSGFNFFLLVLSTLFIAAAGYIINDYFDMRADRVNKPEKMSIGRKIPRRTAIILHWLFNILGVMLGLYLAYLLGNWKLGLLNLVVSIALWFYSTNFKRQILTGNIIISLLSSFVILTVWLFEFFAVISDLDSIKIMLVIFQNTIFPYVVFAFLISFVREVIKDIEDIEGDKKNFCNTFPIIFGINRSKLLLYTLLLLIITGLAMVMINMKMSGAYYIVWYLLITIEIPLAYMVYLIYRANEKEHFSLLSLMTKIIMFAGILSMQVFIL